jgi:membrane protein involved in colicin uptake
MRCPDCNKFVGYDDSNEPEADDADVDADGRVSGTVRVYLACAECGTELKEANFDLESDFTEIVTQHKADVAEALADKIRDAVDTAEAKAEAEGVEAQERAAAEAREAVEEAHEECELECEVEAEMTSRAIGKGRGMKTFYGYHATVTLKCSCGGIEAHRAANEHDDDMQASQMDELT